MGSPPDGFTIDRDTFEPPFRQLADHLKRGIATGEYRVGERLPSEAELSERYAVSRMTARRATGELVNQGLAERRQGRGIYVQSVGLSQAVFDLEGLRAVIGDPHAQLRVLETTTVPADERVAMELEIRRGNKVVYLRQILLHGDQPAIYHHAYVTRGAADVEVEHGVAPLASLLSDQAESPFFGGILELKVHVLDDAEAELLQRPVCAPAWEIEHTLYDAEDRPLTWGFLVIPDELLRFPTHVGHTVAGGRSARK